MYTQIRRALGAILMLKLAACIVKLVVGFWTGSLALIADGLNSVFDAISVSIGFLGVRVASRPADAEHPYGHRKAETIAALAISFFLFLAAWELSSGAAERFLSPSASAATVNRWSFVAMGISLIANLVVLSFTLPLGHRWNSEVLVATGMDTRADVLIAISVVIGLVAIRAGYPIVDPLLAVAIAAFIAKTGIDVLRENLPPLLDTMVLPSDELARIATSVPGVVSSHQIRSRGPEEAVFADLHIQVDPGMSTEEAHAVAHEVQFRLREHATGLQDVTIHVEPAGSVESTHGHHLATRIRRIAQGLALMVHDIWAYSVEEDYYLELHLEANGALALHAAHNLASELETRIQAELPKIARITSHIEPQGQGITEAEDKEMAAEVEALDGEVCHLVNQRLGGDTCHNLRIQQRAGNWDISFHCRLPGQMSLAEAHRTSTTLEIALRRALPNLGRVTIHTEPLREPEPSLTEAS